MDAEIKTLDKEIKQLVEAANTAEVLQNKANYIRKQLELFDDAFLKLRNWAVAFDRMWYLINSNWGCVHMIHGLLIANTKLIRQIWNVVKYLFCIGS